MIAVLRDPKLQKQIVSVAGFVLAWTLILSLLDTGGPLLAASQFDKKLDDPYLQTSYQWAIFIEDMGIRPYLSYPGSHLSTMSIMRTTVRHFATTSIALDPTANLYEDFWYHDATPLGMRRTAPALVFPNENGVVVLGQNGNNYRAATNALMRILVELNLQKTTEPVVLVPLGKYDAVSNEFARYGFTNVSRPLSSDSFTIRLCSYDGEKDDYYYLYGK